MLIYWHNLLYNKTIPNTKPSVVHCSFIHTVKKFPELQCQMMNFLGVTVPCLRTVHTWNFSLDSKLHLNISISDIFFSGRSLICYNGFVSIPNFEANIQTHYLIFCDFYPKFSVYPKSCCVNVKIDVDSYIAYSVELAFSVVDSKLVLSLENPNNPTRLPYSLYFHHGNLVLKMLLVTVDKVSRAVIFTNQTSSKVFEVFDGPAMLSPPIVATSSTRYPAIFTASSFQCLVHINVGEKYHVNFQKLKQHISHVYVLHNTSVSITYDSQLNRSVALLFVQMQNLISVEGVFSSIQYSGFEDIVCSFGGLHVSGVVQQRLSEVYRTCHTDDDTFVNRNIHAMFPTLAVFTHCYTEYCTFRYNLTLSLKNCSVLMFDICKASPFAYQIGISEMNTLTFVGDDLKADCATIQLDFGTDITHVYEHQPNKQCFTMGSIVLDTSLKKHLLFSFHTTGVLAGKFEVPHIFPLNPQKSQRFDQKSNLNDQAGKMTIMSQTPSQNKNIYVYFPEYSVMMSVNDENDCFGLVIECVKQIPDLVQEIYCVKTRAPC